MSCHDGWDPAQYGHFAEQRAQPFWDLVALIQPPDGGFGRCVDLGCGSGELTAEVTDRLGIEEMVGIDSSDAMLNAAREVDRMRRRSPALRPRRPRQVDEPW